MMVRNMVCMPTKMMAMKKKKNTGPRTGCATCSAKKSKSPSAIEKSDSIVLMKLE